MVPFVSRAWIQLPSVILGFAVASNVLVVPNSVLQLDPRSAVVIVFDVGTLA